MNRKNLNSFSTIMSVEQFLTINQLLFNDKPPIVAVHTQLKTAISEIELNEQTQAVDTTIDTTIKGEAKDELIATTLRVAAAMSAVAAATSDTRLRMIADVSKTDLTRMREGDFSTRIRTIFQAAMAVAPELLTWGVTQADIDSLDTGSSSFIQLAPENRNIKAVSTQAKSEITTKISETNALIRNTLDPLMLPYKTLNPTLHGQYLVARATINTAGSHPGKTDNTPTPAV